jgi:membrane fusion protein (multidrug efflux system)
MSAEANVQGLRLGVSESTTGEKPRRRRLWMVVGGAVIALAATAFVLLGGAGKGAAPSDGGGDTAAAAAGATGSATTGGDGEKEKEKAPVPVTAHAVATGPISSYITATANLVPEDEVKVLAEAEGRVAQLVVEEGDRVRRGATLAVLVRDDAQIALEKARLREQNARTAYDRSARMKEEQLISQEALDKLTMENDIARQERAEAEWRLSKTTIRSPFDGRVTWRNVKVGQHVRPGDELFTVADFEPLIARVYLPEKDMLNLRAGQEARLTLKADESVRFQGRIQQIAPVVDPATGTVKITVEAVAPPAQVRPGGFVAVAIVRESKPNAVLLPRQAVLRELQSAHVFVAENGIARKRTVELGLEESEFVEAVSGVAAGEQVIVAGQGGLRDQTPIQLHDEAVAGGKETAEAAVR